MSLLFDQARAGVDECVETAVTGRLSKGSMRIRKIKGRGVIEGEVKGEAIVSTKPFVFFGGVNLATCDVIYKWHVLYGQNIKGKVMVYPESR